MAIFLIRENYPKIDLFGIDFSSLRGVEVSNLDNGEVVGDQIKEDD